MMGSQVRISLDDCSRSHLEFLKFLKFTKEDISNVMEVMTSIKYQLQQDHANRVGQRKGLESASTASLGGGKALTSPMRTALSCCALEISSVRLCRFRS